MGLKSGSRDAELDESEEPDEQQDTEEETDADDTTHVERDTERTDRDSPEMRSDTRGSSEPDQETDATADRPTMSSIPYKLRRNKVNEGREQVPYFLREEIIEEEDQLQDTLEEILDEDVYKSDYREAAMVVAQRNPELVAEVLREWGYDLEAA
jgi:hypothetical protein